MERERTLRRCAPAGSATESRIDSVPRPRKLEVAGDPWYTLTDDFDKDFGVDEWHGHRAFIREGDRIFRTHFVDARGDEHIGATWSYLDITALGRQEEWEDSPESYPQTRRTSGRTTTTRTAGTRDRSRRRRPALPSVTGAGVALLLARA